MFLPACDWVHSLGSKCFTHPNLCPLLSSPVDFQLMHNVKWDIPHKFCVIRVIRLWWCTAFQISSVTKGRWGAQEAFCFSLLFLSYIKFPFCSWSGICLIIFSSKQQCFLSYRLQVSQISRRPQMFVVCVFDTATWGESQMKTGFAEMKKESGKHIHESDLLWSSSQMHSCGLFFSWALNKNATARIFRDTEREGHGLSKLFVPRECRFF